MSNERQINYVNNLQNRAQNLYYVDDASELNNIALKENDKIYAINDNKLFQMEIADQEEELSGAIVSFNGRNNTKVEELTVNVAPIQDLHGFDSPWPAGGGANKLLPSDINTSNTVQSVTATWVTDSEELTLNGTNSGSYAIVIDFRQGNGHIKFPDLQVGDTWSLAANLPTGSYIGVVYKNTSNTDVQFWYLSGDGTFKKSTLAVPNDFVSFERVQIGINPGATFSNAKCHIAFVSGSTITAQTPYSNICPISGHTSATVTRTGKNIVPMTATTRTNSGITYTVNADGSVTIDGTATATSWLRGITQLQERQLLRAGTYHLSGTPSDHSCSVYIVGNYLDGVNLSNSNVIGGVYDSGGGLTFTLTQDATVTYQIQVSSGKTVNNLTVYPQIVYGSTASAYEPYTGNTYTIQLGETVYGGTLDVTNGVLTVNRKTVTLDGSQNVSASSANRFYFGISEAKTINAANQSTDNSVICDKAKPLTWAGLSYNEVVGTDFCCSPVYGQGIAFRWDSITTAADWKTYFTDNPTQFSYELATPIEITLTPTQIDTLLGTNNIWSDAGDTNIKIVEKGITAFELEPHI